MGKLAALRVWFQGKKTILGGSLLIVGGLAGAFTGKLSLSDATTLAGVGISVCGIGAKANHFLGALSQVAQAGVDLRLGNKAGAIAELRPVAVEVAEQLVPTLAPSTTVNNFHVGGPIDAASFEKFLQHGAAAAPRFVPGPPPPMGADGMMRAPELVPAAEVKS